MVDAERSGVMFTVDPASGARDRIVIEGSFGLGEVVVGGQVEPDTYVVDKAGPTLIDTRVGTKGFEIRRTPDGREVRTDVDPERAAQPVLRTEEVVELARLGSSVEEHYGAPQDIEWALADDEIFLVQSRPITTLAEGTAQPGSTADSSLPWCKGSVRRPASPAARRACSAVRARPIGSRTATCSSHR